MHELLSGAGAAPQGGEDRGALWLLRSFAAGYRFMQHRNIQCLGRSRLMLHL